MQGAGAVAAVVMALAADLTREEHRTKAMALIGISIGISFALSMVAGPVLSHWMGLKGMFWLIAGLAVASIVVLHGVVPDPAVSRFHRDAQVRTASFGRVFREPELLRLDFGIFCLHLISVRLMRRNSMKIITTGVMILRITTFRKAHIPPILQIR